MREDTKYQAELRALLEAKGHKVIDVWYYGVSWNGQWSATVEVEEEWGLDEVDYRLGSNIAEAGENIRTGKIEKED